MALITNVQELREKFGFTPILIGELAVDVLKSETPSYDFEITDHPVEGGQNVTDNNIARPIGLTLDCIFTDTDFSGSAAGKALANGTFSVATWQDKRDKLFEIKDAREVIDVQTPLDTYLSMAIQSISIDRQASTANALFCRIVFKEVRIVDSEVVEVDLSEVPQEEKKEKQKKANRKTKKDQDKNKQQTREPTTQENSILADGVGSEVYTLN